MSHENASPYPATRAESMTPAESMTTGPGYAARHVDDVEAHELFPGVRLRTLWEGDTGARAHVLEMDPGSGWEHLDVHDPGPEEVFVAAGTFNDGRDDYPAGTFLHAPAGSSHVPRSATGCTLFLFYPEG